MWTNLAFYRNILLVTNKNNIDDICNDDIRKMVYEQLDVRVNWKIKFIDEITNVNQMDVEQFSREELGDMLTFWVVVFPGESRFSTPLYLPLPYFRFC